MLQNRVVALVYRGSCFLFTFFSLMVHMGVFSGEIRLTSLMYYTIQSNILALIMFGILTVKTFMGLRADGKTGSASYFARFEMVCVVDLLLTLIVYWVLLAPSSFAMGSDHNLWTFSNLSVHLVVPLMCLMDYILFRKRGQLKYRDVYYVLVYPLFYVAFTTVAGLLGYVYRISSVTGLPVRFAYFFIDFDQVGAMVFVYILGLVAFFLVISHVFYWVDKKGRKSIS